MRIGSLFSGYGGLDLACESFFNADTVWHCEWDDAPSKILARRWPGVRNYRDVTQIDWTTMPPVDILTGGYPCQPFSAAGQRKGADDERHLWPYVREAIRYLRPRYTVLENVAGHRSLGFDRVLGDLAEDGLNVWWTSLRASDIGAPHHRERIFILVADPDGDPVREQSITEPGCGDASVTRRPGADAADPHRRQFDRHERAPRRIAVGRETTAGDRAGVHANANGERCGQGAGQSGAGESPQSAISRSVTTLPDAERGGREWGWSIQLDRAPVDVAGDGAPTGGIEWGTYTAAVRRWERVTRPAPAPTELNSNGKPRLNAAFAEWMMGLPAGWVTDVPDISRAHKLKAIGNGVCPPQAYAALGTLEAMRTGMTA